MVFAMAATAQIYDTNNPIAQIVAGSGVASYLEGQGTQAMFSGPSGIVSDTASNLFVLDAGNRRIRRITPDGTTSAFVGGGAGSLPGYGTGVSIFTFTPGTMVIDQSNTIWIACYNPSLGIGGLLRVYADGYTVFLSFTGVTEQSGLAIDSGGNLYFTALSLQRIYRLSAIGTLSLFAGSGAAASQDGNGAFASFNLPRSLGVDAANNIYVWDMGSGLMRRIDAAQNVTTIAGNGTGLDVDGQGNAARFATVNAMTVDNNGNVFMACGSSIRRMSATTNVTTVAGSFSQNSYANGAGALARFNAATGLWLSSGKLFVADFGNNRVRQISFDPSPQVVTPANLNLQTYPGLTINGHVGRTYQLQSSANLSNWTTRATLLLTASPYLWIDQNPVAGSKYYRAVLLP
jgi:hypothetical protein